VIAADSTLRTRFATDGWEPEEVYTYEDEGGWPVGIVARYAAGTVDPKRKTFRQWRVDDGGFRSGLDGQQLPIYRLPETLAAVRKGEVVFIVEGEKCVECLLDLGIAATTNPGGAKKWRPGHSEALPGADVVILPDHDTPGCEHAQDVARQLHGLAARVRVCELPGLPEHGDVVDWLGAGYDKDDLLAIVEAQPKWTPRIEVGVEGWPEPIPFATRTEPEPFPVAEALPPRLGELVQEAARVARVDASGLGAISAAVLSASAGNAFSIRVSPSHAEPNLSRYVAVFQEPGERKSASFRLVTDPLSYWYELRRAEYERELQRVRDHNRIYGEAIAERIKGKKGSGARDLERVGQEVAELRKKLQREPRKPVVMSGDVTAQFLVRLMDWNGGAHAVMSSDARQVVDLVLGAHRRDGKTDDAIFLNAHGGDAIDRGRVGNDSRGEQIVIPTPALAVAIAVQPDKLEELARRPDLGSSGFLARLNLVTPKSLIGARIETGDEQPFPDELRSWWRRANHAILHERFRVVDRALGAGEVVTRTELVLDDEATALRRDFANELERAQRRGGELAHATAVASKAAGEAARLAALFELLSLADLGRLHGVESGAVVTGQSWRCAEAHQRWQLAATLRAVGLAQESPEVRLGRLVLEWAVGRERRLIERRDLVAARIPGIEGVEDATVALRLLSDRGWAREVKPQGRERVSRYEFHPAAWRSAS